jgi:group I intron endonuclease
MIEWRPIKPERGKYKTPDFSGVYLIRNRVTGLHYVGASKRINMRLSGHRHAMSTNRAGHNSALREACANHGLDSFDFVVIERCPVTDLLSREAAWIESYRKAGFLLANSLGPNDNPMRGGKHSAETKEKIGRAFKGRPKSAEHRAKIGAAHRGKKLSTETRAKLSAARKGQPNPSMRGDLNPSCREDHRARMRDNNPARRADVRAKMIAANSRAVTDRHG